MREKGVGFGIMTTPLPDEVVCAGGMIGLG